MKQWTWAVGALACVAVATGCEEGTDLSLDEQLATWTPNTEGPPDAPPDNLHLTASGSFIAGGPAIQIFADEDYGWYEEVFLIRSNAGSGTGPCLAFFGGQCLDMLAPVSLQGTSFMDADGHTQFNVNFTGPSFGLEICFQAAIQRGPGGLNSDISNALCQVVDRDTDGDGVGDSVDACPGADDTIDADGDGAPDACDPCPVDNPDDTDGDGVCDSADICPGGDDTIDTDGDGTPDACESVSCFTFTNGPGEDLIGNGWFDACVDAQEIGAFVTITLRDTAGVVMYEATGETLVDWTYDQITSTIDAGSQYHSDNHESMIELDDGNLLMIAGRNASNIGCGGSFGNGYGLTLYGSSPDYHHNPLMFVGSYLQVVEPYLGVRGFAGWDASKEIMWDGGAEMSTCDATVGFEGSISVLIGAPPDADGDGVPDSSDVCPGFDDAADADGDGIPDDCDPCPAEPDTDGDGKCDSADPCPLDPLDDSDGDGSCDSDDLCPGFDDTLDADGDGTPDDCEHCFVFSNTAGEDLIGNSWFDACVDAQSAGSLVTITLTNPYGSVMYTASGTTTTDWTYDQITSTVDPGTQYYSYDHESLITLDDGNKLMIPGRNAANIGCGGSLGNGYSLVLYPNSPDYHNNVLMFVGSYLQVVEPYPGIRGFSGWDASKEIMWDSGAEMGTCAATVGFEGTVRISID